MPDSKGLKLGRYDYAAFSAFSNYALCSLSIPIVLVAMGRDLNFPLDQGGMAAGGVLHLMRSIAIVAALLFCGGIAGRIGKRFSMGYCMLFMGAGILLCALAPVYWMLIPCLLIAGFGEGICEGIATPFVQGLHTNAPERYVNISHAFWSIGIGICVLGAGGLLTLGVNWRVILGSAGILALLTSLMFLWRENPRKKYPEVAEKISMKDICRYTSAIVKTPRFWVYCIGMFMGAGAEFCLTFWTAAYIQLTFNASAWMAGLGTAAIALGMFIGRTGFGYFARPQNLKHILLWAGIGTIPVTLMLTILSPELITSRELLFTILFLLLFLAGIGIAPYWPTLQVYGVHQLSHLDSTMLYIYFSAMGVPGCGFFTWIMGVFGDRFGLKSSFYLIPASLVLFSLIIFLEGWIFKKRSDGDGRNNATQTA